MFGSNTRRGLLLLALTPMAGCNDSGSGSGGGGSYETVPEGSAASVFGREYCRLLLQTCDCERAQQIFSSQSQCESGSATQLEAAFDEARAAGLEYHPECMGEYVTLFTQGIACHTIGELSNEVLAMMNTPTCKVFAGTAVAGEACESYYQAFGDSCAQGFACFGTCMANRVLKLQGEACDNIMDVCESGSICTATPENPTVTTCVALPGEGAACTVGCIAGLFCDFDSETGQGTCKGPPPIGSPCASFPNECAMGAYCDADVCVAGLPVGSPCDGDDVCGVGFVCFEPIEDGASDECRPEGPLVCF